MSGSPDRTAADASGHAAAAARAPAAARPSPASGGALPFAAVAAPLFAFVVVAIVFSAWPQLDLAVSRLFGGSADGFALRQDPALRVVNQSILQASRVVGVLLAIAAVFASFKWRSGPGGWHTRHRRVLLYVAAAAALGPGLLVNVVLKEHSGRARPVLVQEFGGLRTFTPMLAIADQCERNCSFASGHASISTLPVAGYFIAASRRRRRIWLAAGIAGGLLAGCARIAVGAHFASDVLGAVTLTWLVCALCALAMHAIARGAPPSAVSREN